jgi:Xaa-Pro aminopeptidase
MKTDLDNLMETSNLDALLVTGPGKHNPYMVYLTGGGHLTRADLVKKKGSPAMLFHGPMERDEAAKSGLATRSYSLFPYGQLIREANGDRLKAAALLYQKILFESGVRSGRVALYGQTDLGQGYAVFSELAKLMPEIELIGFQGQDVLKIAMATKDDVEIERIRKLGGITTDVVGRVADYITGQKVKGETVYKSDGSPLTIGDVKSKINLWLSERGAENPEDTIFAMGPDAGVPHSSGDANATLRLGQTIVFDIFPCEAGGGYFYDFTRTWCIGHATDEALKLYEDVYYTYQALIKELKANTRFSEYQARTCELFAGQGHPTIQENPTTEEGYVHSVGHGIGLHVHELPFSGSSSTDAEILVPGSVFTIEPGLYYPERGLGVRLEDSVVVRTDGSFEILAEYPLDLILPMQKS